MGTAVQAQQAPAKAATGHEAKVPAASVSKAVKNEPVVTSAKPAAPASSAKAPAPAVAATGKAPPVPAKALKTEPAAAAPKSAKSEPAAAASKSAKSEPAAAAPKSAKPEPAVAASKSAKSEPGVAASKSPKAESAIPSKSAKPELGGNALKSGKAEATTKSAKGSDKVVTTKHTTTPRLGLVPPPPPDTPTMFAGDGFPPGFGMIDYNNPAVLAGRRKDIASQLASAKKMLVDKEQRSKELKEKAVQFEQLFSEGVISRRELESAQKDAASAVTELNDAKTQTTAYQNAIARLDDRIKPKSVAAKKSAKGKIKASTKSAVKVAGTSVTPAKTAVSQAKTAVTTAKDSTAAAESAAPATTDSTAQAAIKATPGP
ncbi:MAG: hypothetical protein HYX67_05260 [Candidatus Melainabacteria bacterium]|nr:hypothetical protein [Candidatus Melainabacteria bacterium]